MGAASCLGGLVGVAQERERAGGGAAPACSRPGCPRGRAGAGGAPQPAAGPCVYHPQVPEFRDGWKVWPCCGRGSRDWEVLMAVPGCAQAPECLPEGSGGEDGWGAGRLGGSQSTSPAPPPQGGGGRKGERPQSRWPPPECSEAPRQPTARAASHLHLFTTYYLLPERDNTKLPGTHIQSRIPHWISHRRFARVFQAKKKTAGGWAASALTPHT